jgi:hypothetical protein
VTHLQGCRRVRIRRRRSLGCGEDSSPAGAGGSSMAASWDGLGGEGDRQRSISPESTPDQTKLLYGTKVTP